MELSWEKLESYRKNQRSLQEVTEELLGNMKGHSWSFRQAVTDGKGAVSQEKLRALVTEMLDVWAAAVREGTDSRTTGESLADPWLRARRELYGPYLYLVMWCSLYKGAYANARKGELQERADFAFVLEQARWLFRDWCVTAQPDGKKKNEPSRGYDSHFGFHLYHDIADPEHMSMDTALTPEWDTVWSRLDQVTDEGRWKRLFIKHSGSRFSQRKQAEEAETAAEEPETAEELPEEDGSVYDEDGMYMSFYDSGDIDDYEDDDDCWPFSDASERDAFMEAENERLAEEESKKISLMLQLGTFTPQELKDYLAACEAFKACFEKAPPEILWEFCQNLEEIVDLYLAARGIAPLMDTDKTLDVYSRIYDGSLRQAKRYGRGIQWKSL